MILKPELLKDLNKKTVLLKRFWFNKEDYQKYILNL